MPKKKVILFYGLFSEDQSYDWIPYGSLFVYARLKEAGFSPILIHEFRDRNYEEIVQKHAWETLLFSVSAMTGYQIKSSIKAVNCFKKHAPDTPVIWGGAHATAMPYNTLESKYADYVCVGQAKDNFIDFVKNLQNGINKKESFLDIFNLNEFPISKPDQYCISDFHNDLSNFPPFHFEDFDFSYLLTPNKVLNYTASVGCPGVCSFCSWGGKHPWKSLPLKRVLDDIEYLVQRYNLRSVWFSDSELSINKGFLLGLAQGFLERKLNIFWRCNARVAELYQYNKSDYAILEASGLDRFFLGVENVNPEIQKLFRKIIKPQMVYKILEDTKDFSIQLMMSFIFGVPGGSLNDLEENREFINKCQLINPHVRFQVCFYTPYPGTFMADLAESKGYNSPKNLFEYGESPYFLDTDRSVKQKIVWYSDEESEDYIKRYLKLFPKIDCLPEWNWRQNYS